MLHSPTGPGQADGSIVGDPFATRTLDPSAPEFPVPSGAELVNAYAEGNDATAYRLAMWTSPLSVDDIAAFYAGLHDSRWTVTGAPIALMDAASLTLADAQGIYDRAAVDISPGTASRIAVRFVPSGAVAAPTAAAGSAGPSPSSSPGAEQATLPPNRDLPAGFPDWARPPGGTLVDAGDLNGLLLAVFELNGREADVRDAVLARLEQDGLSATVESVAGGEILDISGDHGQVVLATIESGVRASVAVRP